MYILTVVVYTQNELNLEYEAQSIESLLNACIMA